MNPIDLVFLIILVGLSIFGYKKGFIKEAGAIVSLLVSLLLAYLFSKPFSVFLAAYVNVNKGLIQFISFLVIIVGGTIAIYAVFMIFKRIIDVTIIGTFDKILGLLLGVVKTFIILFVVYSLFMWKPVYNAMEKTVNSSVSIMLMKRYLPLVEKYWNISYKKIKNSKEIKENVRKKYNRSAGISKNTKNN